MVNSYNFFVAYFLTLNIRIVLDVVELFLEKYCKGSDDAFAGRGVTSEFLFLGGNPRSLPCKILYFPVEIRSTL